MRWIRFYGRRETAHRGRGGRDGDRVASERGWRGDVEKRRRGHAFVRVVERGRREERRRRGGVVRASE